MGDITKATQIFHEVMDIGDVYLGIPTRIQLAECCRQTGKYEDALILLNDALNQTRRYLGRDTAIELSILSKLFIVYSQISDSENSNKTQTQ